ncbi:hypothetical protein [Aquimarina sp. I32.4]|uniref:hypothetical protein n=1 Tax=Aquimarina sp. I32.4 TaxID=2053903 RepID=UPI000CDEE7F4|nr:hypothetical protein [Aquimarina sp. I32.4]
MKKLRLLLFLVGLSFFSAKAQQYTFKESYGEYHITAYVDTTNRDDISRSNIGFISKLEFKNKDKISIDTIFFENHLSVDPEYSFQSKFSVAKIKNQVKKHFLVYTSLPYEGFLVDKDSIPLEGYFKMEDSDKPYADNAYRNNNYSSAYDYLEKPPKKGEGDWCGTSNASRGYYSYNSETTSEGRFSKGLKEGKWIFDHYAFARTVEHYKNGVRDGAYKVYDDDKNIVYQTIFKNGTGEERIYRDNGGLYHKKHYKNGVVDHTKPYKIFYRNGKIAENHDYPNKTIRRFYYTGYPSSIQKIMIKRGKIYYDGLYEGYSEKEEGAIREKIFYEKDRVAYRILYNYKGKITEIQSGNMVQYFKKGKLKEIDFRNN